MPILRPEDRADFFPVQSLGPVAQCYATLPVPLPATLAAGATFTSGPITTDGFRIVATGVTSTQTGQFVMQRFIDQAATVALGAVISAPLSAGTPAAISNATADAVPFGSFTLTISNTGTASATLTNFALLLSGG